MATERTLILVKPDAFERGLTGEVIARFERKGLGLVAMKLMQADEQLANTHYEEHADKPFFGELVSFITRGPLVAMVLEGESAVAGARQLIGATNPLEADSAGSSPPRSPSTSCTARTPPSRPRARSHSGSPRSSGHQAAPL
jgi:nucleoside-diphosphate kinase